MIYGYCDLTLCFKDGIKMISTDITQIETFRATFPFYWIMTEQCPLSLSSEHPTSNPDNCAKATISTSVPQVVNVCMFQPLMYSLPDL